jgi:hypothetical protein
VRASWLYAVLGTACFAASPPAGVPCDPAAPTCPDGQACHASGTGFACLAEAPPVDAAAPDTIPASPTCGGSPKLSICFDFDAPTLSSPLTNEGRVAIAADLVDVTRIDHGTGGAAGLGATSTIVLPTNSTIIDIVRLDASIRLDVAVPDTMRIGILDADGSGVGSSMFVFGTATGHQLRCNVGEDDLFANLTVALGEWVSLSCVCEAGMISALVNDVKLAEQPGCAPSVATVFGLTIGQNNQGLAGLPPNEPLIGAIDDVRLSTAP